MRFKSSRAVFRCLLVLGFNFTACLWAAQEKTASPAAKEAVTLAPVNVKEWRKAVLPRFTVYSQIPEDRTLDWIEEFDQFLSALNMILKVDERLLNKPKIVLMRGNWAFKPFRPLRPDGKDSEAVGFFGNTLGWSAIGMAEQDKEDLTRRIIFHEGVHWYLRAAQRSFPVWMEEGLAEAFSTFSVRKGFGYWGGAIESHNRLLRELKPMTVEQLLLVKRNDGKFNDSLKAGLIYAQSWALVHCMLFAEQPGEGTRLGRYLEIIQENPNAYTAMEKAFNSDMAEVNRQFQDYTFGGKYFMKKVPLQPSAANGLKLEPVSQPELHEALAWLALGGGRIPQSELQLKERERLAPADDATWTLRAWQAFYREDGAGVLAAVNGAKASGINSPDLDLIGIYATLEQRDKNTGLSADLARSLTDTAQAAVLKRPFSQMGYRLLASLATELKPPSARDYGFLKVGWRLFPNEPDILISLVAVTKSLGLSDESAAYRKIAEQRLSDFSKRQTTRYRALD